VPWKLRPLIGFCSANTSGSDVKLDGAEHLIVREGDILGVIEG